MMIDFIVIIFASKIKKKFLNCNKNIFIPI